MGTSRLWSVPGGRHSHSGDREIGIVGGSSMQQAGVSYKWDVFICHASEDKDVFVRELAQKLKGRGIKVWYDEFTLKVGDSLLRSIDDGLRQSRYGIVILSKAFFEKNWPQKELDGLVSRERDGEKVILPIWLGITKEEVAERSPILTGLVAIHGDKGTAAAVEELLKVLQPSSQSNIRSGINWIENYKNNNKGQLPPLPEYLLAIAIEYKSGQPISKSMKVRPASAQLWDALLPSQREKLLQLVEWLGQDRRDYQVKMRKLWPKEVPHRRTRWRL